MIRTGPEPPSRVTPRLWVGGAITADTAAELLAAGVTHVLNVRREPDDRTLLPGVTMSWAPIDDLEWKGASWFRRGLAVARVALQADGQVLYVHCAEGVHRAPLMTYPILRALDGLGPAQALRAIRRARANAQFPPVYLLSAEAFLLASDSGPSAVSSDPA